MSLSPGIVDELIAGLATQEVNLWDNSFVPDVQDHLFESAVGAGGLDLVALNIQRGRDHGIKGQYYALAGWPGSRCDQIGRLIALWATFQSLWQQFFAQIVHIFRQFL